MARRCVTPWLLLALSLAGPLAAQPPSTEVQAIVLKVVRDVARRAPGAEWARAAVLDSLLPGHEVQTAAASLAMIEFADATKLVLRERSLMHMQGQVEAGRIIDRSVELTRGSIAFSVEKQEKESFRFASPMAVASVRGTRGAFVSADTLSLFILAAGRALLTNPVSGDSAMVSQGQTGISRADGSVTVRPSTPEEERMAADQSGQGRPPRRLQIPGVDASGNRRTLILEWEEP